MSGHTDTIRRAFALGFRMRADGAVISPTGRVRKAYVAPHKPYGTITLRVDGEWRRFFVHKLAAFTFFGEEALAPGVVVRHLDGDSLNNRRENLALGTQRENMLDRAESERRAHALKAAKARRKLTPDQARELVKLSLQGWTGKRLAAHYGLAKSQVSEILSGKLYSEATGLTQRPRSGACLEQLAEAAKGAGC